MHIRKANYSDMQNIVALHIRSWRENYRGALSSDFLAGTIESERAAVWKNRFSEPSQNQMILVAEDVAGFFCGFICIYGNNDPVYGTIIDNLHVRTELKGKGIGSLLMKAAARWANENYSNMGLYLEVLMINSKAETFYQSRGAEKLGTKVWYTPCGNEAGEFLYGWSSPATFLKIN